MEPPDLEDADEGELMMAADSMYHTATDWDDMSSQEESGDSDTPQQHKENSLKENSLKKHPEAEQHKENSLKENSLKKHPEAQQRPEGQQHKENSLKENSLKENSLNENSLKESSLKESSLEETSLKKHPEGQQHKETSLKETSLKENSLEENSLQQQQQPDELEDRSSFLNLSSLCPWDDGDQQQQQQQQQPDEDGPLSCDQGYRPNAYVRLDTVEELTETTTTTSSSFQLLKGHGDPDGGQKSEELPSLDLQQESLPLDTNGTSTSMEQLCGTSEMLLTAPTISRSDWVQMTMAASEDLLAVSQDVADFSSLKSQTLDSQDHQQQPLDEAIDADQHSQRSGSSQVSSSSSCDHSDPSPQLVTFKVASHLLDNSPEASVHTLSDTSPAHGTTPGSVRDGRVLKIDKWDAWSECRSPSVMMMATTPVEHDSGIERSTTATNLTMSSSSAQRSLAKYFGQIHLWKRNGGSTESPSSLSPVSDHQDGPSRVTEFALSPEVVVDSPREGGFLEVNEDEYQSVALLKKKMMELKKQLAAAEHDKQTIAHEAYRKAMQMQLRSQAQALHSQSETANLVHRLQSKLKKYKGLCEHLQSNLKEVSHLLPGIADSEHDDPVQLVRKQLLAIQESHEVQAQDWQGRLKAQQEENAALKRSHDLLRSQLQSSVQHNATLVQDAETLTADWNHLKDKVLQQDRLWHITTTQQHLDEQKASQLLTHLASLKTQFADLKGHTQHQLLSLQEDLADWQRQVRQLGATLNPQMDGGLHQGHQAIAADREHDLWMKLHQVKVDKQLTDRDKMDLEKRYRMVNEQLDSVKKQLHETQHHFHQVEQQNELLKLQNEGRMEQMSKSLELASHNQQLQSSLLDIAQMVLTDADRHQPNHDDATTQSDYSIFVSSSLSTQMHRTIGDMAHSTMRPRASSVPRRRRSASPAMMESTTVAVQAALNRRQLQVHELGQKLLVSQEKLKEMQTKVNQLEDLVAATEDRLQLEKHQVDQTKLQLDQVGREKESLLESIQLLSIEKESAETSRSLLQADLKALHGEHLSVKESYAKVTKEVLSLQSQVARLEQNNDRLVKDSKDQFILISQLEKVGSSLREELIITKGQLQNSLKALDAVQSDKEQLHQLVQNTSHQAQHEHQMLVKSTKSVKDKLDTMEQSHSQLVLQIQSLEQDNAALWQDKNSLTMELQTNRASYQTLKQEMAELQSQSNQLAAEKSSLQHLLRSETAHREKLDAHLKGASEQRDELENQVASLILQKEALQDEAGNLMKELSETQTYLDKIFENNVKLGKDHSELEAKAEQLEKELADLSMRHQALKRDKVGQLTLLDEVQLQLDESEDRKNKLMTENSQLKMKMDSLRKEVASLQEELTNESDRFTAERNQLQSRLESVKESLTRSSIKHKSELERLEKKWATEKADWTLEYEHKLTEDISKSVIEKQMEVDKLQTLLQERSAQMEMMKQSHADEVLLQENEKQRALMMAQQEYLSLKQLNTDLKCSLDQSEQHLETVKREHQAVQEKLRLTIHDCQVEVSRTKSALNTAQKELQDRTLSLKDALLREEQYKLDLDTKCADLKAATSSATSKAEALEQELVESRHQLCLLSESKKKLEQDDSLQIEDLQSQVRLLERLKLELEQSVKANQEQISDLSVELHSWKSKVTMMEKADKERSDELASVKEELIAVGDQNRLVEQHSASLQRQLQTLQRHNHQLQTQLDQLKSESVNDEEGKESAIREMQVLKIRLTELESIKVSLERDLEAIQTLHASDQSAAKQKMAAANQAVEETRAREKRLEDQRHFLEMSLSSARQESKELQVSLSSCQGKMAQYRSTIDKWEQDYRHVEDKLLSICQLLHSLRSSSSAEVAATPTRLSRLIRRPSSPWLQPHSETAHMAALGTSAKDIDVDQVTRSFKDFMAHVQLADKKMEDTESGLMLLQTQNEDLMQSNSLLQSQVTKLRLKVRGTEEQVQHLQEALCKSDVALADKEKQLERRDEEMRLLSNRLDALTKNLDKLHVQGSSQDEEMHQMRQHKEKLLADMRALQEALEDSESRHALMVRVQKCMEGDHSRLQAALADKEAEIEGLKSRCAELSGKASSLEEKCSSLNGTVDHLRTQLDRVTVHESELQSKVSLLTQNLQDHSSTSHSLHDHMAQLQRSLSLAQTEKRSLQDQMDSSRVHITQLKQDHDMLNERIGQLEKDLQLSESKANQYENALHTCRTHLEAKAPDNYLKEELARMRRENDALHSQLKELNKKLSALESDKMAWERRQKRHLHFSSGGSGSSLDAPEHVRTQIPLMAGSSWLSAPQSSSQSPHCAEHVVKIQLLEQKSDSLSRKNQALQQQLCELNDTHSRRVQELLREQSRKREKENSRHEASFRQLQTSFLEEKQLLKKRVVALEREVTTLKEQLSREMKTRQRLISNTTGISNEIMQLRHNLDKSLQNVTEAHLDGALLDRESSQLNFTIDRFGSDVSSHLTPSKLIFDPHLHSTEDRKRRLNTKKALQFDLDESN